MEKYLTQSNVLNYPEAKNMLIKSVVTLKLFSSVKVSVCWGCTENVRSNYLYKLYFSHWLLLYINCPQCLLKAIFLDHNILSEV